MEDVDNVSTEGRTDRVHVTWKREDGAPLSAQREERNGLLILYDVKQSDAGKYVCVGTDSRGPLFAATISLRIVGKYVLCPLSHSPSPLCSIPL